MAHPPHALILGGSGGVGAAVAADLARRGYALSLIARRQAPLEAVAARHPGALVLPADATDKAALSDAVAQAAAHHGPPDLVAACAGRVTPGRFEDLGDQDFLDEMALNLHAVRRLMALTLPDMRTRGAGRALIIGSAASFFGLPGYAAYGPTKFALAGLAQTLRAEYAGTGVTVTICHPADTDTPQLAAERRTRPPELSAIADLGGVAAPEAVARAAVAACLKGRATCYPDWGTYALHRLSPVLGPALWRWGRWRAGRRR